MNLIDRYLGKSNFTDYDDYFKNLRYKSVTEFNFGYDVVDEYATRDLSRKSAPSYGATTAAKKKY